MIYEFYSGSYGSRGEEGIVKFCMDTERETITKLHGYKGIQNPSYLAFHPSKNVLYAVQEEVPVGAVHALRVEENGLFIEKTLSTEGADPCYVSLDSEGKIMLVDNYTSGSLAVYAMGEDGLPERLSQMILHEGRSAHPTRQSSAHVHCAREHEGTVYAADLGADQIFLYETDPADRRLRDTGKRLSFPAGSGPRHLEFHRTLPGILYVVCELTSQVAVWKKENRDYVLKQTLKTIPENFAEYSIAAAIKMQGDLLFVSNRGHDSIAVYRTGEDGLLTLLSISSCGGKTPRDFAVFGDYLAAANQDSDRITVLKIDWETGALEGTGMYAETVKPTCIQKYG